MEVNHAAIFDEPHSSVKSLAATSILGGVVSSIVYVAVVVIIFKHSSVAVKVTVADPVLPQSLLNAV